MSTDLLQRLDVLLKSPDPVDLPPRRHKVTCAGDPRRRQTVLLPLLVRWCQTRYVANDPAPYIAPAKVCRFSLVRRVG